MMAYTLLWSLYIGMFAVIFIMLIGVFLKARFERSGIKNPDWKYIQKLWSRK